MGICCGEGNLRGYERDCTYTGAGRSPARADVVGGNKLHVPGSWVRLLDCMVAEDRVGRLVDLSARVVAVFGEV